MDYTKYSTCSHVLNEEKNPLFSGHIDDPFEQQEYNRTELAYWLSTLDKEIKEIQRTSAFIKKHWLEINK